MSRLQRVLLITAFVGFVVVVAYFLYILFFRPATPSSAPGTDTNINSDGLTEAGTGSDIQILPESGTLPRDINANVNTSVISPTPPRLISSVARGGLTETLPLSADRAISPEISADGTHLVYYDKDTGQFFKITPDGSKSLLSNKTFPQVDIITWSPDRNSAILEFPDGANIHYNFASEKQVTLPKHWEEFDFSPESDDVIVKSIGTNKESRYLIVSDPEGQRIRSLSQLPLDHKNIIPAWSPNNLMVAMVVGDGDLDAKEIFFVGLNNENFKSAIVDGLGFEGQWAPNGRKLTYSVHSARSDNKPELWVVDAEPETMGANRKNLKLQTWAHKCTFQNDQTMYCAVPSSLESGAGFYPNELDNQPDSLYRVDINSGATSLVALPDGNPNMQNLSVSPDGRFLFYVNSFDGLLYRIQLR